MTASEIRSLFAVASRPEVVSLAGGMPYVQALDLDMLADGFAKMIRERGATDHRPVHCGRRSQVAARQRPRHAAATRL